MESRLNAKFVAHIHQLQRELESKNNYVLNLEEQLHATKEDHANLTLAVEKNAREAKSNSRQMQSLQGCAEVAVEEMGKERDAAVASLAEARKRLDVVQKKMRNQEQETNSIHEIYEREKHSWASERTRLERKVNLTEDRLRIVLAEVTDSQVNMQQPSGPTHYRKRSIDAAELEAIDENKVGNFERPDSRTSNTSSRDGWKSRNTRSSVMITATGGMGKRMGMTLADELPDEYDEEDYFDDEDEDDRRASLSQPRPFSAQSHIQSSKARRLLGLTVESEDAGIEGGQVPEVQTSTKSVELDQEKPLPVLPRYTDGATQFSPPDSPSVGSLSTAQTQDVWCNNEQKRFSADQATPLSLLDCHLSKPSTMVSTASQTIEQPISPPDTPIIKEKSVFALDPPASRAEMVTSSTQTEEPSLASSAGTRADDAIPGLHVPVIAIHPPNAGSASDRTSVVLPPQTKNVGVQAAMKPSPLRSVSVQTEEIRIDQRPVKLPPHLLPSAISSNPPSPVSEVRSPTVEPPRRKAPLPPLREPPPVDPNLKRPKLFSEPTGDEYLNDDGPLVKGSHTKIKRPVRNGSLFAGFDDSNVAERGILTEAEWTDEELRKAKAPARRTLTKVGDSWKLVPRTKDALLERLESHREALEESKSRTLWDDFDDDAPEPSERPEQAAAARRADEGNATVASNGTVAQAQRRRSPSAPPPLVGGSITSAPPFPVPTRYSSRRAAQSASDGARSPTPRSTSFFGIQRSKEEGRPPTKKPMLRKVRSAAATTKHSKEAGPYGEQSPQSPSSTYSFNESLPPPIPKRSSNRINGYDLRSTSHQSDQPTTSQASVVEQVEDEGVSTPAIVDAVAFAMVGEWMWKYTRRRTSFGKPEPQGREFESPKDNGPRHKRWVWAVPIEKAILWSAKQPTSGSTLLGKNARKRELIFSEWFSHADLSGTFRL